MTSERRSDPADPETAPEAGQPDPLSPRERVRVRVMAPNIRSASVYGARGPALARSLRRTATEAEALLWRHLRSNNLGFKFRRQQGLGAYVLDFYCHERALVVEVDGAHHLEAAQATEDEQRTRWLEAKGLQVLRFTNREVLLETNLALEQIRIALEGEERPPSP
jgi:very-short-patch-repair endonuclease